MEYQLFFLEDPEVLGYLKLMWVRSSDRRSGRYNRRVSIFKSSTIEEFTLHAPEYGLEAYYVDPAYTSKLAELVAKDMGLDRHTALPYLIALEHLGLRPKQVIKVFKNKQKSHQIRNSLLTQSLCFT